MIFSVCEKKPFQKQALFAAPSLSPEDSATEETTNSYKQYSKTLSKIPMTNSS